MRCKNLDSDTLRVLTEPLCKFGFGQITGCEGVEREIAHLLGRDDGYAVLFEKTEADDKRRTFIAVDKCMILRQPIGVRSSKLIKIGSRFRIGKEILRSIQRGLEKSLIAQTTRSAMRRQLKLVNDTRFLVFNPDGFLHSASRRRTSRFSSMMDFAISIFSAKSG